MIYDKILLLDNNIHYTMLSYNFKDLRMTNNPFFYYQYQILIKIYGKENDIEFFNQLNKLNYSDTTLILFSINSSNCIIFEKSYLESTIFDNNILTLCFEGRHFTHEKISKHDKVKYLIRDLKIKSILDT